MASSSGGIYSFPPLLEPRKAVSNTTRYVTIESPNGSLSKENIFWVTKSIKACAIVEDIRKNFRAGTYTVRVSSEVQANQLKKKLTQLIDGDRVIPVQVIDDVRKNFSRAVITCRDLIGISEKQIESEMADQGVVGVRHFRRGAKKEETGSLLLTFNRVNPPEKVKVACYESVTTRTYYPPPALCYECFEYDHISKKCNGPKICVNCSQGYHGENISCPNLATCKNCGGDHAINNRQCPMWKKENLVVRTKVDNNISYPAARKLVEERTGSESYTSTVANGLDTIEQNKWKSEVNKKEEDMKKMEEQMKKMEDKFNEKLREMMEKQSEMDANYQKLKLCMKNSAERVAKLTKELDEKQKLLKNLEQEAEKYKKLASTKQPNQEALKRGRQQKESKRYT